MGRGGILGLVKLVLALRKGNGRRDGKDRGPKLR